MNPEVERIKKLNLDNEQTLKRIQEENEKKVKQLKEENEKIQQSNHNEFMRLYNDQISSFTRILQDIGKKKEGNSEKTLEQKYRDIKNRLNDATEEIEGECEKGKNAFKAGILEEDELVNEEVLTNEESTFISYNSSTTLKKEFKDKIIVGWKLKSIREDGKGGSWRRNSEVLGQSSYSFYVASNFLRDCNWKLRIWTIKSKIGNYNMQFL